MNVTGTTPIAAATKAGAHDAPVDPALEKAARAFEAIFLRQMIGAMRQGSLSEGIFDSSATDQFRDMADARTADEMAKTGKFGIAELLISQFSGPPAKAGAQSYPIASEQAPEAASSARDNTAVSRKGDDR